MAARRPIPPMLLDPQTKHEVRTLGLEAVMPKPVSMLPEYEPEALTQFRRRGRPTEYFYKLDGMVTRMLMTGMTVVRICEIIGIAPETWQNWLQQHPSFAQAVYLGREGVDGIVVASLFQRAVGYSHHAEKISISKDGDIFRAEYIEHFPPDVQAAIYWLNNRTHNASMRGVKRMAWTTRNTETHEDVDGNAVDPTRPPQFVINAVTVKKD